MGLCRQAASARWWVSLGTWMLLTAPLAAAEHSATAEVAVQSDRSAASPVESQGQPTVPANAAPAASPAASHTAEDDIRAQLTGTRWALQLTPLSGEGGKPQKDTVIFDGKQVSSERLTKAGFPLSNYTLTVGEDGVAIWETMQTKEGEGVAFWRGELRGSTMRGVLSKHPTEGQPEDFSFTAEELGKKSIGGSAESRAVSSGTTTAQAAAPPVETSKKKKHKKSNR